MTSDKTRTLSQWLPVDIGGVIRIAHDGMTAYKVYSAADGDRYTVLALLTRDEAFEAAYEQAALKAADTGEAIMIVNYIGGRLPDDDTVYPI